LLDDLEKTIRDYLLNRADESSQKAVPSSLAEIPVKTGTKIPAGSSS